MFKESIKTEGKEAQEMHLTEARSIIIAGLMNRSLKLFQDKNNGKLPDQIVMYRDGCGGPTMETKIMKHEVEYVTKVISDYTQDYNPKILYVLVNKRITHRLFEKDNGGYMNPGPGTVLDTALVESEGKTIFDFFLVPHRATVATALPVHFKVVHNTTSLTKDQIETSTYHLCYNYVNFCGGIKVPAPCMYASKIANYAHENKVNPNADLSLNLHFL
jgi:aubergine-like protein